MCPRQGPVTPIAVYKGYEYSETWKDIVHYFGDLYCVE